MPIVSVELNLYYMHYNDARVFAEWAAKQRHGTVNPSIYVRHAIISVVFASEALINRVLTEFSTDPNLTAILDRVSLLDKWYLAPFLCSGSANPTPFEKGVEPYQSFKELIQIRNWLAHPRVDTFLQATVDPKSSITDVSSDEEYPWLEMLKGEQWPQTGFPKNPFEIDHTHADASLKILDTMIEALTGKLAGQLYDGWLDLITIRDDEGLHQYTAPVYAIWGGYGGANG